MIIDDHGTVTIPVSLLRDIFGHEHSRSLLLLVTDRGSRVRYSEARDELGLHPQQFQRALDRLEEYGLIGLRAPADLNKPDAKRDYYVFLEATALGRFAVTFWERMNADFSELARERNIPEEALMAAAGPE